MICWLCCKSYVTLDSSLSLLPVPETFGFWLLPSVCEVAVWVFFAALRLVPCQWPYFEPTAAGAWAQPKIDGWLEQRSLNLSLSLSLCLFLPFSHPSPPFLSLISHVTEQALSGKRPCLPPSSSFALSVSHIHRPALLPRKTQFLLTQFIFPNFLRTPLKRHPCCFFWHLCHCFLKAIDTFSFLQKERKK